MVIVFLFIVGACVGSFLGALTWRWPREIAVSQGRSKCFSCNRTIRWFDNIPVLSYLVLRGKCRDCGKGIPRRDFAIELGAAILFPLFFVLMPVLISNVSWIGTLPSAASVLIFFTIVSLMIIVFVIDLEHQYIPDTAVFLMLFVVILSFIFSDNPAIYTHILSGLGASLFLLAIHLATLGRGMGLGDVKLALAVGTFLGFPLSLVFMFLSFVLGSLVGIVLIAMKLARFKQKIAFGPFMVISFFVTIVLGRDLLSYLYGYY